MTRRECLTNLGALGLMTGLPDWSPIDTEILKRKIPSTGELLPSVGVGTWQTFDVGPSASDRDPLKDVLKILRQHGGKVLDSSPMYGRSEKVAGDISMEMKVNAEMFMATKVWTTGEAEGIRQMENSFSLLQREKMDLMQVHNLVDWQTHLKTLHQWKEQGKVRYVGLTHYTDSMHDTLINVAKANPVDFIQVNFNLLDRHASKNLLPFAKDKGIAILVNRPFEEGALFQKVKGKTLPEWAREFDCGSWAQFFLKFILAHEPVTCVIPGTGKPQHMTDNIQAGLGKLPAPEHIKKMIELIAA